MGRIERLRLQIDAVDRQILGALAKRQDLVARIGEAKVLSSLPIRDVSRERQLFDELRGASRGLGLDPDLVCSVFRRVVDGAVRLQEDASGAASQAAAEIPSENGGPIRVAFQGAPGAYSQLAARRFLGRRREGRRSVRWIGCPSFRFVVEAVAGGQADVGVLPVENSLTGPLEETNRLVGETGLRIVDELTQPVDHCLVAVDRIPEREIRRVFSHPQALAQCSAFLAARPAWTVVEDDDTAGAAVRVRQDGIHWQAAIASRQAAKLHGLTVLRRGLADRLDNETRFVALVRSSSRLDVDGARARPSG